MQEKDSIPFAADIIREGLFWHGLPLTEPLTLPAMQAFGGYALIMPSIFAAIAGFAALLLWYLIGRLAAAQLNLAIPPERYNHFQRNLQPSAPWLLLFAFLPIGFAVAAAAGLFRLSIWRMAIPASLSMLAYYSAYYLI